MPTPNNDGFEIRAPRYIDLRQGKLVGGKSVPYSSVVEALTSVIGTRRAEGLIMYVKPALVIEEWWFVGGTADVNFVQKLSATPPINQDNILRVVTVSLTTLGLTTSATEIQVQTALAAYIEGMIIPEDEIWYFQVTGFLDSSIVESALVEYADNAAAILAGLVPGDKYKLPYNNGAFTVAVVSPTP